MNNPIINEAKAWNKQKQILESKINKIKQHTIVLLLILVIFLLALIGVLVPLKKLVPVVVQVDKSTGNQAIVTSLLEKSYTPSEAEDKFNIKRYIQAREGYSFDMLDFNFNNVKAMTDDHIVNDYIRQYVGKKSRQAVYKNDFVIYVKIISISINKSKADNSIALIRTEIIQKDLKNQTLKSGTFLINLSYYYDLDIVMTEQERLDNPLGFTVDYYQIEKERI